MELTAKLVFKINASAKPLACDCFDIRGRTKAGCPVCGGKGPDERMPKLSRPGHVSRHRRPGPGVRPV